ncbi:keratin, type II cytoskeletal 1-like [Anopheles nili]|uniref:keratin, type II cytoskeletal 1-like n=1 Tax=Anopheles nili TaxID=185578 RepID=UPI00237A1BF9|nr:keratin, type II cytoskeletal 1-like [Anopheles nili]
MKQLYSVLVLALVIVGLAAAYPAPEEQQQPSEVSAQPAGPVEVTQLVPVAEGPESVSNEDVQRSKRHLGFGGVGIGVGVGLVGGGFGGYPGFGYGGYPGYGYGGFYPGYGYGGYRRFGYRYGGYGYGGGLGYPYFF